MSRRRQQIACHCELTSSRWRPASLDARATALPVSGIFAVVRVAEAGRDTFFSPDHVARATRVFRERLISFTKILIDRMLALVDRRVVAVVDYSAGHAGKDRLYNVQELRTAW